MFCVKCGKEFSGKGTVCSECASGKTKTISDEPEYILEENPKSLITFGVLSFFVGLFGIHNFYVGDWLLGFAKLGAIGLGFLITYTVGDDGFFAMIICLLVLGSYVWALAEIAMAAKKYHVVYPDGTEVNDNYYNKIYKKRHKFHTIF